MARREAFSFPVLRMSCLDPSRTGALAAHVEKTKLTSDVPGHYIFFRTKITVY
jgi:hypothetical protein